MDRQTFAYNISGGVIFILISYQVSHSNRYATTGFFFISTLYRQKGKYFWIFESLLLVRLHRMVTVNLLYNWYGRAMDRYYYYAPEPMTNLTNNFFLVTITLIPTFIYLLTSTLYNWSFWFSFPQMIVHTFLATKKFFPFWRILSRLVLRMLEMFFFFFFFCIINSYKQTKKKNKNLFSLERAPWWILL